MTLGPLFGLFKAGKWWYTEGNVMYGLRSNMRKVGLDIMKSYQVMEYLEKYPTDPWYLKGVERGMFPPLEVMRAQFNAAIKAEGEAHTAARYNKKGWFKKHFFQH